MCVCPSATVLLLPFLSGSYRNIPLKGESKLNLSRPDASTRWVILLKTQRGLQALSSFSRTALSVTSLSLSLVSTSSSSFFPILDLYLIVNEYFGCIDVNTRWACLVPAVRTPGPGVMMVVGCHTGTGN